MEVPNYTRNVGLMPSDYFKDTISRIWPGFVSELLWDITGTTESSSDSKELTGRDGKDLTMHCDTSIEEAASKFRDSVNEVFRAEHGVDVAIQTLKTAEEAYRQVCNNLQQHSHDFSEHRFELELSVSPMKSRLSLAGKEAEGALLRLKHCKVVAADSLASLRRAESDLETRMLSTQKSIERARDLHSADDQPFPMPLQVGANHPPQADTPDPLGDNGINDETKPGKIEHASPEIGEIECLRSQLARLGISVAANTSEALLRRIYAAAVDIGGGCCDNHPLRPHSPSIPCLRVPAGSRPAFADAAAVRSLIAGGSPSAVAPAPHLGSAAYGRGTPSVRHGADARPFLQLHRPGTAADTLPCGRGDCGSSGTVVGAPMHAPAWTRGGEGAAVAAEGNGVSLPAKPEAAGTGPGGETAAADDVATAGISRAASTARWAAWYTDQWKVCLQYG